MIMVKEIRQHSRQMVRELDLLKGIFQDSGCSYSQCHALFEIEQKGILNLMELSNLLLLDKSTTSRLVKGLMEQGLVKMGKTEKDQRQKLYSLTENGQKTVDFNNEKASAQVAKAIQLLDKEEQLKVEEGLKLYARALGRSRLQSGFEIRPIRQEDNQRVGRLIREVMTEYGAVGEGYSIEDPEVDQMYEAFNNDRAVFFVICKDDDILGCGGIGPLVGGESQICELKKMYFLPELRGMGFGKRIVSLCLEEARRMAYQECYLETVERMWQANLLYKKMGFQVLSKPKGCTGHSGCDSWYIKKLETK